MGRFKQIKSDTRQWNSGRVKLSPIGIPDKPETYYIMLEKDFFGRNAEPSQRFNIRALDWVNLKRLIEGPDEGGGWAREAQWSPSSVSDQQLAQLAAQTPEFVEAVLSSPNLGNFSSASLEALDRLAERVFEIKNSTVELIFSRLADSSSEVLRTFSHLLGDLRLSQVSLLSDLVYQKLKVLDIFEKVITDPGSSEEAVHVIYENNPWMLGRGLEVVQSDKPLANYLTANVKNNPELRRRPDLIVGRIPHTEDVILVELKAPGVKLRAEHIGQVLEYKALIKRYKPNVDTIHCFLYGHEKSDTFAESNDVTIKTFGELIAELRDEYREYSDALEIGKSELNGSLQSLIEATEPTVF